jgi:hypothetical protein
MLISPQGSGFACIRCGGKNRPTRIDQILNAPPRITVMPDCRTRDELIGFEQIPDELIRYRHGSMAPAWNLSPRVAQCPEGALAGHLTSFTPHMASKFFQ